MRCVSSRAASRRAIAPIDFDADLRAAHRGSGSSSTASIRPTAHRDERCTIARQAYAGLLWSKQFYHYVVLRVAGGRSGASRTPPAAALERPQQRLAASLQSRRHLDAGQLGVSRGTRVGSRVPHGAVRRASIRTSPRSSSMLLAARMVHAPERADSGLRIRVRRRESAGACLGGVARLQNHRRRAGSATAHFSSASFKSC